MIIMMNNNEKIKALKLYSKAAKQAKAIISMDSDLEISNDEFRKTKRKILTDEKILTLAKNNIEKNGEING